MPISLDRPSAVKRGSGRPSLDSASGVIISGFALMPPRGVNHSGFRSGRVLVDRFPDSFPRTDNHEPPQLGKSRVLSHHGSTMTSSSGCRSPGRPESLGLGYEIMYTAPLRLTGRPPWPTCSKRREGLTGFHGGSLGAVRRYGAPTAYARHPERSIREYPFLKANETSSLISQKNSN